MFFLKFTVLLNYFKQQKTMIKRLLVVPFVTWSRLKVFHFCMCQSHYGNIVISNIIVITDMQLSLQIKQGDTVVVNADEEEVRELQKGHGEWNDNMGRVSGICTGALGIYGE